MTWRAYGTQLETADMSNLNKYYSFTSSYDFFIKGIHAWIIVYNDPAFTSLHIELYENAAGSVGQYEGLIGTTGTVTKAEIHTDDYALRDVYFEFSTDVIVRKDIRYTAFIQGSGYTYAESSHLALKKAWPKSLYTPTTALTDMNMHKAPYEFYLIGARRDKKVF